MMWTDAVDRERTPGWDRVKPTPTVMRIYSDCREWLEDGSCIHSDHMAQAEAAEMQWNRTHGLTATCPECGGPMKEGSSLCSWRCWHRSRAKEART